MMHSDDPVLFQNRHFTVNIIWMKMSEHGTGITEAEVEIELLRRGGEEKETIVPTRTVFSHKVEYLLTLIGYSVGFGNVWRFPYLCMKNGGGAFLVPFVIFMVICALPLYYLELSLGQFAGKSALVAWEICPLFRGLGFCICFIGTLGNWYFGIIMAWTLCYLFYSFFPTLPWSTCDNSWNTDQCVTLRTKINLSVTDNTTVTASETVRNIGFYPTAASEFWRYRILHASSGIEDVGTPQWHLILTLFLSFGIIFLCLIRGVKSVGKVVYVSAILPYILLTVIFIRSLTLEGSVDGVMYFIKPDFGKLANVQVWVEAAVQAFFSLGPGWGGPLTIASFSDFRNKTLNDSLLVTFFDTLTSFFCGFVVFSIIGFLAKEANLSIEEVAETGPGLVFLAYPEALARLPLPQLWSVLFFMMVFNVGLDSQFGQMEAVISGVKDMYPKRLGSRTYEILIAVFVVCFTTSIIFSTQAGVYIFQLLDWYASVFCVFFISLLECIVIGWIYGSERFSQDIEMMTGQSVPRVFRISWCIGTPISMVLLIIARFLDYKEPTYKGYIYPPYTGILGTLICLAPVLPIFVVSCMDITRTPGTLPQRLKYLLQPPVTWKPKDPGERKTYRMFQYSNDTIKNIKANLWGAFLVPFVFFMVICALPLYYLELCLGQFSGKSSLIVWEICPLFRGMGVSMCFLSFIGNWYLGLIMAWTLCYIVYSFFPTLPWSTCDNSWNTDECVTLRTKINNSEAGNNTMLIETFGFYPTSASEFWRYKILHASSGLEDWVVPQWHLVLALFTTFSIIFLCLMRGVKSIGKVVYVSVILPYVLLAVILVRSLTLEGSLDGVMHFIKPDFTKLGNFQVWLEAAVQAFFSMGVAWGGSITMASFSDFRSKTLKDALIVTFCDILTAFFCGIVVFSILGYLAREANLSIDEVAEAGPGLVFLAYPEALARLPLSQLWSVLFFIMLFNVGLDTQFAQLEAIVSGLKDMYPGYFGKRTCHILVVVFVVFFSTSIIFSTQAGVYIFQLVDWYASPFCIFFMCLLECVIIGWIYGSERFSRDIMMMTVTSIPRMFRMSWCIFTPIIMILLTIVTLLDYKTPTYKGYVYPAYTSTLGVFMTLAPVTPIIAVSCFGIIRTPGTILQKLRLLLKPPLTWIPKDKHERESYKMFKYSNDTIKNIKANLWGVK